VAGLRNGGVGLFGGYPSAPSLLIHLERTRLQESLAKRQVPTDPSELGGEERLLPYCEIDLRSDDVLIMTNGGGGGYGDPLERDPQRVLDDVLDGLVSPGAALTVYGVALRGGAVDAEATEQTRARLRGERGAIVTHEGVAAVARGSRNGERRPDLERPVRENLEIASQHGSRWLRCAQCGQWLCPEHEDWLEASSKSLVTPTRAGPLMQVLVGEYVLAHWTCPACSALFETQVITVEEAETNAATP
jgi:N-methylhydantoinase B